MPFILVLALRQLPLVLAEDAPGVRERLFPTPYPKDPRRTEEWRRHALPDLLHLFASAREIVERDLGTLRRERFPGRNWRLEIPARHLQAWLSALAAGRVALGTAHAVEADDMEGPFPAEIRTERDRAILLIQLLAEAQAMLIEGAERGR